MQNIDQTGVRTALIVQVGMSVDSLLGLPFYCCLNRFGRHTAKTKHIESSDTFYYHALL